jgi:hypothetical protein
MSTLSPSFTRAPMAISSAPEQPLAIITSSLVKGASGREYFEAMACFAAGQQKIRKVQRRTSNDQANMDIRAKVCNHCTCDC